MLIYFQYNEKSMKQIDIITTLKARRKSLNINQTMLADIAGVSLHTISDMESGKGNPTMELLLKITDSLGLVIIVKVKDVE